MISGFFRRQSVTLAFLGLLLLDLTNAQAQTTNGIFADFTTSLGNFTCQLEYSRAPKAVSSFIALATGQRPWLDLNNGLARQRPFYEGITFHRVIAGFMIQGGSPNGQGTDGPGYVFVDEFSSQLTFSNAWVLAMANSGPDSNGSQFFVTVAPYVSGNNKYTIFGHVTAGTNVVWAINHVATDSTNDKPLTNVVIQHVDIRRVGTAAQAFDINAHSLPWVTNVSLKISPLPQQVSLSFSNKLYADNHLYSSPDLATWSLQLLGVEVAAPFTNAVVKTNGMAQQFFRLAQVQYASSTFAPKDVYSRTLTLNFANNGGTLILKFDNAGSGTYTFNVTTSGTITGYSWTQQPYRGLLWPIYYSGNLAPMTLQLAYQSSSAGSFSGTVYSLTQPSVSGTFKSSGP
jgi:peptidyl-prolyl cis-trans isomerase A (cyclophilin A)